MKGGRRVNAMKNDVRIKSRDTKIRHLEDEIKGLKAFINISQAYVAYLVEKHYSGVAELDGNAIREFLDHPEYIQARITDKRNYVVKIVRPK